MIKKPIIFSWIFLLLVLFIPLDLWGATYYFSDKSLATLDAQLRDLRSGDTLIFLPGTYAASGEVTISPNYPHNYSNGLPGSPIIIKALEKGSVILEGGNDWTNGGVVQEGAFLRLETGLEYWGIEGLTIQNTKGYGILIKGNHLQIKDNEITRAGWDGIKTLCGSNDVDLINNLIIKPYEDGIDVFGTNGAKVLGNVIDQANNYGIFAKGGSRNILIEGNRVIQSYKAGIIIGGVSTPQLMCGTYECTDCKAINNLVEGAGAGGIFALGCDMGLIAQNTIIDANTTTNWTASLGAGPGIDDGTGWGLVGSRNIRIANNIVKKNMETQNTVYLRVYGGSTTGFSSDYNLYFGLTTGPRFSWNSGQEGDPKYSLDNIKSPPIAQETHSIMADPLFFNPQRGDYHLQSGSPAKSAGRPLNPEVTKDFEGWVRSVSLYWDIGAYAWSARPLVTTDPISNLTFSTVSLKGTVNPNGNGTTYGFQWGATTDYGNTAAGRSAVNGTSNVAVTANLSGLTSNTTYHYRLVATNSSGTTYGLDMTFTTQDTLMKPPKMHNPLVVSFN
jgi:hypothetical protein